MSKRHGCSPERRDPKLWRRSRQPAWAPHQIEWRGMRPADTALRAAVCASAALALVSAIGGRDAREPGRVVTELLVQGKSACDRAPAPAVYAVPFSGATWLCDPGHAPPRLVGHAPGELRSALFTASNARVSD